MSIAVKFYSTMPSDDENIIKGISGKIPAIVEFTDVPPDDTYKIMTDEEYNTYLASISKEMEDWKAIQETQGI